ncbi:hypothetical protein GIB67_021853 [Kingdonia uniflora]|uniref:Mediator complex subunit 15 KIX domain-containing protein n=1 Tax=Kingdonia uniflora TaxID=39325 RepID=A0A7J7P843_9MAGN|nr:hypothetical protein GIB67_021853 [Kingdonia uniflora]
MDNNAPDWRTQLQDGSRQRIVNKIIESLKKHLPVSGHEGMQELMKIAERFEERIYTSGTTTSQSDYLRKISMKMLTMETKTQNVGVPNSNASGSNQNLPDTASHSMQTQVRNQGQPPVPLPNQSQGRQQLLSQSMQNTIAPAGVQSSSGLMSALPSVTGLSQPSMLNTVSQSSNLQDILGISQNSVSNNAGQGIPSNILASSQKQMQGRPHPHQVLTSVFISSSLSSFFRCLVCCPSALGSLYWSEPNFNYVIKCTVVIILGRLVQVSPYQNAALVTQSRA